MIAHEILTHTICIYTVSVALCDACQLAKRIVRPRWHPTTLCPLGHWHSLHANTLDGCCEGDWFTFIMCQCKADTCHCHASDRHHCFWLLRTTYLMICCQMCRVSCVFVTSRNRIREPKCCCFKGFLWCENASVSYIVRLRFGHAPRSLNWSVVDGLIQGSGGFSNILSLAMQQSGGLLLCNRIWPQMWWRIWGISEFHSWILWISWISSRNLRNFREYQVESLFVVVCCLCLWVSCS